MTNKKVAEKPRLPGTMYGFPAHATTVVKAEDAQQIMIDTDGWIMAQGYVWYIQCKDVGAGCVKLSLKQC